MCLCASLCVTLSCVMCSSGLSGSVMNPYGPVGICLRYSWGQPNELDPYTVIIRLITMFRYKMTKINRENARSRSAAKGWLDNVDRRRVSRSAASWMLRSLGKVSQRREKIHIKKFFKMAFGVPAVVVCIWKWQRMDGDHWYCGGTYGDDGPPCLSSSPVQGQFDTWRRRNTRDGVWLEINLLTYLHKHVGWDCIVGAILRG